MTEGTSRYHVSETKSDFSKWAWYVIGDDKLSRDLQKSAIRSQAARSVAGSIIPPIAYHGIKTKAYLSNLR